MMKNSISDIVKIMVTALGIPVMALVACSSSGESGINTVFSEVPEVDVWLVATHTIGVEAGDSNFVFGQPVNALRLENGGMAVLDMMKCRVYVFDENGGFSHSFGREGSGPGEFLMPSWLSLTPSGGFVVSDAAARRLFFFDSRGAYTGEMGNFFPGPPLKAVFLSDSVFIGQMTAYETAGGEMLAGFQVARWTLEDFDEEVVYFLDLKPFNLMNIGGSDAGLPVFTASQDGTVYTSTLSTEEFVIRFQNPDGTELLTIEEPFTRVPKTTEEIENEREYIHGLLRRGGAPEEMIEGIQPEEYRYALTTLFIGPEGDLWAGTGVYEHALFRVYCPLTGEFLYTAAMENSAGGGRMAVQAGPWGFTAIEEMPADWPRVWMVTAVSR